MTFIAYSAIHFVYTWRGDLLASLPTISRRSSGEVFHFLTWTDCTHRCRSPHYIGIRSVACSGLGNRKKNKFAMILNLFVNLRRTLDGVWAAMRKCKQYERNQKFTIQARLIAMWITRAASIASVAGLAQASLRCDTHAVCTSSAQSSD